MMNKFVIRSECKLGSFLFLLQHHNLIINFHKSFNQRTSLQEIAIVDSKYFVNKTFVGKLSAE